MNWSTPANRLDTLSIVSGWTAAFVCAGTALASTALLTGTSVWFLASVALTGAGPAALVFNFHHPAALIRLLALLRTGGKYGERLMGHRAALLDQVERRAGLFGAMALSPATRSNGWQLGHDDRLSDFLDDVEDVDYARLRIRLPLVTSGCATAALLVPTAYVAPLALAPLAMTAVATAALAVFVKRRLLASETAIRAVRRSGAALLGAFHAAVVPLTAEGARVAEAARAAKELLKVEQLRLAQRKALALLDAAVGLAGPVAAMCILGAAWLSGVRAADLLPPLFIGFAWIAIGEAMHGPSRILTGAVKASLARNSLAQWHAGEREVAEPLKAAHALSYAAPVLVSVDGRILDRDILHQAQAGRPLVLRGQSGYGKTTLLKRIAGWIDDGVEDALTVDGRRLGAAERRASVHLGLHDAAILSDTVRSNLFAPETAEQALWEALAAVEMDGRIREAGGLDAWITQDMLSLGEAQRLNLARAYLSAAPLVLLDEPGEHLAAEQSDSIMRRLEARFAHRILIRTSHR